MEFLNTALTFPTAIFSILVLVVMLFWTVSLIGLADIDMFEGDVEIETSGSEGIFSYLGLSDIPVSITASIIILVSWILSFYCQSWFLSSFTDSSFYYLVGSLLILMCFAVALPITAITTKPLKSFFKNKEAASKNDFIGLECTIATGKVTDTFGQAKVNFKGTEQLIEIRVQDPTHQFNLGDSAILIEHLSEQRSYIVAPKPWA